MRTPGLWLARGGKVFRTDDGGATWKIEVSGTRNDLNAVSFIDPNAATVVGAGGTILRSIPGEH